ncbi:hypothetical protein HAX54_030462 [Datura stramonium]|uniref:Uncharacterized protein n=1 Tax=Datura stramonium TaxID=4076 RepID=A0ABS8SAZ1_DATST|nr:hypothetical protein [Datura stramonium]
MRTAWRAAVLSQRIQGPKAESVWVPSGARRSSKFSVRHYLKVILPPNLSDNNGVLYSILGPTYLDFKVAMPMHMKEVVNTTYDDINAIKCFLKITHLRK